jgi:chromosome segregation ATPase
LVQNKERELSNIKSTDSQKVLDVEAKGRKEEAELNAEKKAFDVAESQLKAQAVETAMAKRQLQSAKAKDSALEDKVGVAEAKFDYAVSAARHELQVRDHKLASAEKQHEQDVSSMKLVLEALHKANATEERLERMVLEKNHAINDLQAEIERLSSLESNYSRKVGEFEIVHNNDTTKLSQVARHAADSDHKVQSLTSELALAMGNASALSAEIAHEKAAEQSLAAKIGIKEVALEKSKKEAGALRVQAAHARDEIQNLTSQASLLKAELKQATGLLSKDAELLKQSEERRKRLKEKVVGKLKALRSHNRDLEAELAKQHSK